MASENGLASCKALSGELKTENSFARDLRHRSGPSGFACRCWRWLQQRKGNDKVEGKLLKARADRSAGERGACGYTLLYAAPGSGSPPLVKAFLDAGAHVYINAMMQKDLIISQFNDGHNKKHLNRAAKRTPLHHGAYLGHRDAAKVLIVPAADVNMLYLSRFAPLEAAYTTGEKLQLVLDLLLLGGANKLRHDDVL